MDCLFSPAQSEDFFSELRAASVDILKGFGLPISQGWKRHRSWTYDNPLGVTLHFTAGVTWKGSVRWLNDGGHANKVSCQMLILDRLIEEANQVYEKYPLLKDLESTTLMLSDGIIPCWHAGWVNRINFGIENRNAGILRGAKGKWRWWARGWKAQFPHEELNKKPILIDGRWWEPYTYEQVHDNILVCQHLHCLYQDDGGLDESWFLPHSATEGTKSDTGRAFPFRDVRKAVFDQTAISDLNWIRVFQRYPETFVQGMEERNDEAFIYDLIQRAPDRCEGESDPDTIEDLPSPELQELIQHGSWRKELDTVRSALDRLGYVTGHQGPVLDDVTALAVYQFQKSQKDLKADKIPGDKTQEALYRRLQRFGLHMY